MIVATVLFSDSCRRSQDLFLVPVKEDLGAGVWRVSTKRRGASLCPLFGEGSQNTQERFLPRDLHIPRHVCDCVYLFTCLDGAAVCPSIYRQMLHNYPLSWKNAAPGQTMSRKENTMSLGTYSALTLCSFKISVSFQGFLR